MTAGLRAVLPQPFIGVACAIAAAAALIASVLMRTSALALPAHAADVAFALCLGTGIVLAYRFPIRVRSATKMHMNSVPLFMLTTLLPISIAVPTICAGKLIGSLAVRSQSGAFPSDIATQVGRWTVVAFGGSLVSGLGSPDRPSLLFATALTLWLGDLLTGPLLLCPATGEPPLRILREIARDAGPMEAAQYVFGILGTIAAAEARWTIVLLLVPMAMMYLAFHHAKDIHESARRMLAGVVDAAPDAIVILDTRGNVVVANNHAAPLFGRRVPDEVAGHAIDEVVTHDDRARLLDDIRGLLDGREITTREYAMTQVDGKAFNAEITWSALKDRRGHPTGVSAIIRDITRRKQAEEEMAFRALHDALTGLPNRVLFRDRLMQAARDSKRVGLPFSLLLIDLDRFKQVNDSHGHRRGDVLLTQVADRLRGELRDSDTVARLGGDEFGVLLPKAGADGAEIAAGRLLDALSRPFVIEEDTLAIYGSIGIAVFPDHADDLVELQERADAAMYAVKRGGGGYRLCSPADREDAAPLTTTTQP